MGRLASGEEWDVKGEGLFFLFPTGGAGRCLSGRGAHAFVHEDVLVLDLSSSDRLCANQNSELRFNYFTLSFEHLLPLFAAKDMCLVNNLREALKSIKLYPAASPVALQCHRLLKDVSPEFELEHRGQLLRIASSILSLELKQAHAQRVGLGHAMEHITQLFEQLSVTEIFRLSVDELADRFGCSARHLNRLFHQYFGFSVAALRMELRMLKAVSLLRDPNVKILDIADECGFNYLSLFNDCFKKRFGTTPGRWRKLDGPDAKYSRPASGNAGLGCPIRINGLCPWSGNPVDAPTAPPVVAQSAKPKRGAVRAVPNPPCPAIGDPPEAASNTLTMDQSGLRRAPTIGL